MNFRASDVAGSAYFLGSTCGKRVWLALGIGMSCVMAGHQADDLSPVSTVAVKPGLSSRIAKTLPQSLISKALCPRE